MPSDDTFRDRYIEELIDSTAFLESMESAAIAEAWASSAVAEWLALGGSPDRLARHIREASPFGAALIEWIEGGDVPQVGPVWVADIGAHELLRAVRLVQERAPDEPGWILEYVSPSGDRHDLSATIVAGELVGLAIGPEGLVEAAKSAASKGLQIEVVEFAEAIDAIRASIDGPVTQLSEAGEATLPLLVRRLGGSPTAVAAEARAERVVPTRDPEDDRYAADVVESALRSQLGDAAPAAVHAALASYVQLRDAGDPDALTIAEVIGSESQADLDIEGFVRLVGAYLAPTNLGMHTDPQFAALVELEPADWVGVVLGMARSPVGTPIDGDALVTFVNRTPEITTTIPKTDAPRIAWTFEQMLYAWQVTGVLDDNGAVSAAAAWLLPRAALAVWRTF